MAQLRTSTNWITIAIVAVMAMGFVMVVAYGSLLFAYFCLNRWPSQEQMVPSGYPMIPEAKHADDLLEHVWHKVGNYRNPDIAEWHTEAFFAGRYNLVMFMKVRVDKRSGRVTQIIGKPQFILHEIRKVTLQRGGGLRISYRDQHEFGHAEWKKVVAAGGDFSEIGIQLKRDQPVANFDKLLAYPRHGMQTRRR